MADDANTSKNADLMKDLPDDQLEDLEKTLSRSDESSSQTTE